MSNFTAKLVATIEPYGDKGEWSVTIRRNGKFVSSTIHISRESAEAYAASRKATSPPRFTSP